MDAELAVAEALNGLAMAIREAKAKRAYYYETVNVKRWVPDADACEICEDNADLGWIDDDAVFEGVFDDVDEPPAHPHCGCDLEYKEQRKRVYV